MNAPAPKPRAEVPNAKPPDPQTAAAPAAQEERATLSRPLAESRWSLREHKDPGHWVCLERDTPYEKVFDPSFWANIAVRARFQPGQSVYVTNDELTVFARLIVLECGRNWVVMGEYDKKTREDLVRARPPSKERPRHRISHGGPIDKFRILRDDNQVIKSGFESEAAAQAYLDNYLRLIGA
jgi:hypothetical protein